MGKKLFLLIIAMKYYSPLYFMIVNYMSLFFAKSSELLELMSYKWILNRYDFLVSTLDFVEMIMILFCPPDIDMI